MEYTIDTANRGVRIIEYNNQYFLSLRQDPFMAYLVLPDYRVVREYKDRMYDTNRSYGNNCAHMHYVMPDYACNLDLSSTFINIVVPFGEEVIVRWSSVSSKRCGGPPPHDFEYAGNDYVLHVGPNTIWSETKAWHRHASHGAPYNHYINSRAHAHSQQTIVTDYNPSTGKWAGDVYSYKTGSSSAQPGAECADVGPTLVSVRHIANQSVRRLNKKANYLYPTLKPLWHFGDTAVANPYVLQPKPSQAYCDVLEGLKYNAFLSTLDNFEVACDNNIANLIEASDILAGILRFDIDGIWKAIKKSDLIALFNKKRRSKLPVSSVLLKYFGDLWLKYRYMYTTTKSDIEQMKAYASRRAMLKSETWRVDGYASDSYLSTDYTIHCGYRIRLADTDPILAGIHHLYELGMLPTGYCIYDMIPFSFVADWFLHFGDFLGYRDKARYVSTKYIITDYYYTLSYVANSEVGSTVPKDYKCSIYTRWYDSPPSICYGMSHSSASRRTILKRSADVVSLTTGKL